MADLKLNGTILAGTMKNIEPKDITIEPEEEIIIETGVHSGEGVVRVGPLSKYTVGTSTSERMLYGNRGWVNGKLVSGTLSSKTAVSDYSMLRRNTNDIKKYDVYFPRGVYTSQTANGHPEIKVPQKSLVEASALTAEKIAKGKQYLGVEGTYTSDATATENDIKYGYIGYANGERIVGKLKTTQIYLVAPTIVDQNTIILSWSNPPTGPYEGVKIWVSTNPNERIDYIDPSYKGHGSNIVADGRSSVQFNSLIRNTLYYFFIRAYCGTLKESDTIIVQASTPE